MLFVLHPRTARQGHMQQKSTEYIAILLQRFPEDEQV